MATMLITYVYSLVIPYSHLVIYSQLKHPNIVSLLGYTKSVDEIILIMNYIDGDNLDRMIFGTREKREVCTVLLHAPALIHACYTGIFFICIHIFSKFTSLQVKGIAAKIACGVQYMHHHDPVVIHQDLKPQNVLVCLSKLIYCSKRNKLNYTYILRSPVIYAGCICVTWVSQD